MNISIVRIFKVVLFSMLFNALPVLSASFVWNGGTSTNWNTATNWTPNGIPGALDNVTIGIALPNPCIANGANLVVNNFTLNGTGSFQLAANAALTINGNITYLNTASATFNCSSTLHVASAASQNIPALSYGTLNLTGGNRVLAASGTIKICGNYVTGAGTITVAGSTIEYNGTGAQTITAANYNNLSISQNRGGAMLSLEPGTINVGGDFIPTLSNYAAYVDGNTFNFSGAAGQIIPAFFYFNITSSAAARVWANAGIIDVKGTFTPPTTGNTITGSTVRFSSTLPGINLANYTTNVNSRNFNNVIFDGIGGSWNAGTSNLNIDGTLEVSNGTVNVATNVASTLIVDLTTTVNGGVLNVSSGTAVGTGTFTGAVTVNGGQLNIANGTSSAGIANATAAAINVLGGLFVVSNSVAAGTLTQSGTLTIDGGIFRMGAAGGASTVTNSNNNPIVHTSGGFDRLGGTAKFIFSASGYFSVKNWIQGPTATMSGVIAFTMTGGSFPSLKILSDINLGNANLTIASSQYIRMQGFVISGGTSSIFRCYNGGRFFTDHPDGIMLYPAASGCIQTKTRYLGGSVIWYFEGNVPQKTGDGFPGSVDAITISNTTGFTLNVPMRIQNSMSISGNVYLGDHNLTLQAGVAISGGTNSANKMIVTNGLGMLVKMFTSTSNYTYPIGDNTGTPEYSPVKLTFSAITGTPDSIGFRVTNAQHPNDYSGTNYLTRYWSCNQKASANYTYVANFYYQQADVVGNEADLRIDRWSNPLSVWTQDAGSTVNTSTNILTSSSLNQSTGTLLDNDFAGRSNVPAFYYQTVSSGLWSNPTTWEVSTDSLFIAPLGATPILAPDANNSVGITIKNTHTVTVAANTTADQMNITSGAEVIVNASKTLSIQDGIGTDLLCKGKVTNSGVISNTGQIEFTGGGLYDHAQNSGTIPAASWTSVSTALISGVTTSAPSGLTQNFYNLEWNTPLQTANIELNGNLTTIVNDFTIIHTGSASSELRLFSNSTIGTLTVGGNMLVAPTGKLGIINSNTSGLGEGTVIIEGNLAVNGVLDMTGSTAQTAYTSTINLRGNLTVNGTIIRTQNIASSFVFDNSGGAQTFTSQANGINSDIILWRVGDGVQASYVELLSNMVMNSNASIELRTNSSLKCTLFEISGGTFTNQNNSNLIIGSALGITIQPQAAGNIQTLNRTYVNDANYEYAGTFNQNTGDGLPFGLTGNLTIANTGAPSNNKVALTSSGSSAGNLYLNAGVFEIGTAAQFNIKVNGTVLGAGGSFANGSSGGTLNFNSTGSFTGANLNPFNVNINNAVSFPIAAVTIQSNGTFKLNTGSSVTDNPPIYSTGSFLEYAVNGAFNRGLEWSAALGGGFPHHVRMTNATILNVCGLAGANSTTVLHTAGDVTIDSASTLLMSFGGFNMSVPLKIQGDLTFAGTLIGSNATGGNIQLVGNFYNNGLGTVNYTPNNRTLVFEGSALQTIGGSNTTMNPFSSVTINNLAGVTLTNLDAQIIETLTLSNGKLNLNSNTLTVGDDGSNGAIVGGSSNAYLISGTATAQLVRYTTSNATTYNFPVGDAANYTPMSVQFFTSPMNTNSQLSVNVIPGVQPNLGSSSNYLKRYWQVEPINLPSAGTDYAVQYVYDDGDVIGAESGLKPYKHNATGWVAATGSGAQIEIGTGNIDELTNTISWTGLTSFSDFTANGSALSSSVHNMGANEVNFVSIYPNPTRSNTLHIQFNTAADKNTVIRVFDLSGKQMMRKQVNQLYFNEVISLPIDELSAGIYFVEVAHADWTQRLKLSVVR